MKPYLYPDAVLMIFCKAPAPGQVKTRLLAALSAADAAALHIELSLRTIQLATQTPLCPVQIWCAPTTSHPFFAASARAYPVSLHQQQGANLGERMQHAFCSALKRYSRALLIGCDCPSLIEHDLEQALMALDQPKSCVLAPAEDGGYVLIGLNQPHSGLFSGVDWGTRQVFAQTRGRIEQLNLHYIELKQQWDLDEPADLARYRSQLNKC